MFFFPHPPKATRWEICYRKQNHHYSYRFQYYTPVISFVGMTKAHGL
jgi:hypothetical protein